MLYNTLWSDSLRLITKKHFLPLRVPLNVGIDPNFPQKGFFLFFGFIQTKISLSGENIFSCRRPIVKYMKPDIHYANFYNRSTDE